MIAWFVEKPLVFKIILGVLGTLLLLFLLWLLWLWLWKYLEWQNVKTLEIKERVELKIEFIKTAAQILGGAFFLLTIYVAWQNLVISQEKYKTDLFTRAIDQLGSEKLEVRLGGIYALERIAGDSDKDYWPIMETLTAFVRERAPWQEQSQDTDKEKSGEDRVIAEGPMAPWLEPKIKPATDIQAVLTVLKRRKYRYGHGETERLNLRGADLRGAVLDAAHLEGAVLSKTHLEGAKLMGSHLERADLGEVHLEGANLHEAHLEEAFLRGAHLEAAVLWEAHLETVTLLEAHLEGTILQGAHLEGAKLWKAHLEGANLWVAHLEGAEFFEAHLEGANFKGANLERARGLTWEQLAEASMDEKTKLPDYLKQTGPNQAEPK